MYALAGKRFMKNVPVDYGLTPLSANATGRKWLIVLRASNNVDYKKNPGIQPGFLNKYF